MDDSHPGFNDKSRLSSRI